MSHEETRNLVFACNLLTSAPFRRAKLPQKTLVRHAFICVPGVQRVVGLMLPVEPQALQRRLHLPQVAERLDQHALHGQRASRERVPDGGVGRVRRDVCKEER